MLHILKKQMKHSLNKLVGARNVLFQQDNDPKHKSKICQKFLENEKVKVLPWPSQSQDLNPLENLW